MAFVSFTSIYGVDGSKRFESAIKKTNLSVQIFTMMEEQVFYVMYRIPEVLRGKEVEPVVLNAVLKLTTE